MPVAELTDELPEAELSDSPPVAELSDAPQRVASTKAPKTPLPIPAGTAERLAAQQREQGALKGQTEEGRQDLAAGVKDVAKNPMQTGLEIGGLPFQLLDQALPHLSDDERKALAKTSPGWEKTEAGAELLGKIAPFLVPMGELAAGGKAGKLIGAGFGVGAATQLPEVAKQAGTVFGDPKSTVGQKMLAGGDIALTGGMAAAGLGHAAMPEGPKPPPEIGLTRSTRFPPEVVKTVQDAAKVLPQAAEAAAKRVVTETPKEVQFDDLIPKPANPVEQPAVAASAAPVAEKPKIILPPGPQPEGQFFSPFGDEAKTASKLTQLTRISPEDAKKSSPSSGTPEGVEPEMVTLYRGEGENMPKDKFDKLPVHQKIYAGQWFSESEKDAQNFADAYGGKIRSIQVPKLEAEQYRIAEGSEFRIPHDIQEKYTPPPEPPSAVVGKVVEQTKVVQPTPVQKTPLETINTAAKVKITAPEGATMLRGTTAKGKEAIRSIAHVTKSNPFNGSDITKLEAGTMDSKGKFKPMEGDIKVEPQITSMGGQAPGDPNEIPKTALGSLDDSLQTMAEQGKKPEPSKAFNLGESLAPIKDGIQNTLSGLRAAGDYLKKKLEGFPEVTQFTSLLGDRHLALSESALNTRRFVKSAMKAIPDKLTREAITNWVDNGGDMEKLKAARAGTKPAYQAGYDRAMKLTPEETIVARNIQQYFEARLKEAQEAGILEDGIENYIHRYYEKDSPWKQSILNELRSGIFTGTPALAKQRIFQFDHEAEAAGYTPQKDFVKRVAAYDLALNKAIADRNLVKGLMNLKTADGSPWISVAGAARKIGGVGTDSALMIKPTIKPKNVAEYRAFDHPALRKWKWVAETEEGQPVLVQGDVLVHPDAISKVKNLFESSRIRQNPVGRAALQLGSTIKQTMLDFSGFHPVQITIHGFEHRSFKPIKEIDLTDPDQRGLVKGGLVIGDTTGREHFDEGLSGSSLSKLIPGVGEKMQQYKEWLFGSYIPRLKMSTGLHALERNRKAFPNLTPEKVNHLTANEMNAAFGELNYAMLGRSATMQDALRLTLLSPDFTEARARFVGQAATKYGGRPNINEGKFVIGEQGKALLYGAAALYITARIVNKILNDQYHFEPKNAFNVVHNGKAYSLRTVQGDVLKAATEPAQFIRNRLNPVYGRTGMEIATGRDYFGRKRDAGQQAADLAKEAIPISAKGLFSGREQSLAESLMNSFGVTEHRESPMFDVQQLAEKWKEKNRVFSEPGEFIYDPDKDPFRGITLAARYDDDGAIRSEIGKAVQQGATPAQIQKHFKLSSKHLFTASTKSNEEKFKASLSADERKQYDAAVKERNEIADKVKEAIHD